MVDSGGGDKFGEGLALLKALRDLRHDDPYLIGELNAAIDCLSVRSHVATTRATCTLPEFIGKADGFVGNEHHHAEVRKHWDALVEKYSTTEFRNTYNEGGSVWNDAVNLACGIKSYLSTPSSTRRRHDCQTGTTDVCLAAQLDGIVCPSDSCDIDNGVRSIPHALSRRLESVAKTLDTEGYSAGAEWVREAITALSARATPDPLTLELAEELFGCFLHDAGDDGYQCGVCEEIIQVDSWVTAPHAEGCAVAKARAYLAEHKPGRAPGVAPDGTAT